MVQLSNHEIAQVFCYYPNAKIINPKYPDTQILYRNTMMDWFFSSAHARKAANYWDTRMLLLTPVGKISDETARLVVLTLFGTCRNTSDDFKFGREKIENGIHEQNWFIRELLRLTNHDLPLWFGVGNENNGKTAIELGIALDEDLLLDSTNFKTAKEKIKKK